MARDVEFDITGHDKTAAALRAAERNFARTNDKIKKQQEKTSDLLGGKLFGAIDKISPKLAETLAGAASRAGSLGGPLMAAGLAAALPMVGAALSGAIIGGAGIGGVIGGVTLAARDPRVQAAGKALGDNLMSSLERDALTFVGPVLQQIDRIQDRFQSMRPTIQGIFQDSDDFLGPLVDGAMDAVDSILKGIKSLTGEGGPVIDSLSAMFSEVGASLGRAMEIISGGSHDAADALDAFTKIMVATVEATAWVIRGLTELAGVIMYIPKKINGLRESLTGVADENERIGGSGTFGAQGVNAVTGALEQQAPTVDVVAQAMDRYAQETNDAFRANNDLYSSTTGVAEAMDRARKAIDENGRTLSLNTEKGRANRNALSDVAGALQRQYDAYVKVNGVGAGSAAVAEDLRGKFVRLATQAGMTAGKARELANQLLNIPQKRETKINAPTAAARAEIKALQDKVNGLRGKTVTVTVNVNASRLNKVNAQLNSRDRFSAGSYWGATDVNAGGMSRTGGPTPVSVTSDVVVNLDGRPFYDASVRAAQQVASRAAWRQKVGHR